jgi:hypothetical protein
MDTHETETLTLEQIDARLAEIPKRLEEITGFIKTKTDELGKSKIRGLLTPPIHKSIRALEDEQRELIAEQEYLTQERERLQKAITRQAAEDAAVQYQALSKQLEPLAIEIIKALCTVLSKLIELDNIELLMKEKATAAGNLVNPISGVIRIQPMRIARDVDRALFFILSSVGKEKLDAVGIQIPNIYDARGGFHSVQVGSSEGSPAEPVSPPAEGFDAAMYRAAGLEPAPTD